MPQEVFWKQRCSDCNELCTELTTVDDGKFVCEECLVNYVTCNDCGDLFDRRNVHMTPVHDGHLVCEACIGDYAECVECGELWSIAELHNAVAADMENVVVCQECLHDNYVACDSCGVMHHVDITHNIDGTTYCEQCYSEQCPEEFGTPDVRTEGTGCTLGVEIECYPENPYDVMHKFEDTWQGVEDGSLEDGGLEYCSPILRESNFEQHIREFCDALNARVDVNCGLHVHIDSSDLSWWEVQLWERYCYRYQPFFHAIVAPSRRQPSHCGYARALQGRPVFRHKHEWTLYLYGEHSPGNGLGKYPPDDAPINRQVWFNVHSHFYRRTIEIRLHQGTTEATKIINWIKLMLTVKKHATSVHPSKWLHPFEYISDDLKRYYRGRIEHFAQMLDWRHVNPVDLVRRSA